MNNYSIKYTAILIILILAQVVVFNHINFLGYINPYIYIIFLLIYPFNNKRTLFILVAFALGLLIDIFSDSGGVNAIASTTIAYIRPIILRFAFGVSYLYINVLQPNIKVSEIFIYTSIVVLIHHLILFSLEIFNPKLIFYILTRTLFSSIFTVLLSVSIIVLFSKKRL